MHIEDHVGNPTSLSDIVAPLEERTLVGSQLGCYVYALPGPSDAMVSSDVSSQESCCLAGDESI